MKIRTIAAAVKEFKEADQNTSVTSSIIRSLIKSRRINHYKFGSRTVFVDLDEIQAIFHSHFAQDKEG